MNKKMQKTSFAWRWAWKRFQIRTIGLRNCPKRFCGSQRRKRRLYSVLPLFKISHLPSPDTSAICTHLKSHFFRFVILIQQLHCTRSTIFQYLCTSLLFHVKAPISKYGTLYAGVNGTFVPKITFNSFSNCDQLCRFAMTEMPIKLFIGNDASERRRELNGIETKK